MHLAHRNCEYILGVIYLFVFPVLLWADNKVNTYHFKSISTSVNFPTNEVRKLFQDSQGVYMDFDLQWSSCVTMVILLLYINPME